MEKIRPISMGSLRSPPPKFSPTSKFNPLQTNAVEEMRSVPHIAENITELPVFSPKRGHARKQSYSLFPNDPTSPVKSPPIITREKVTSVYDISALQPPPAIFGGVTGGKGHRRDSSIASSATVQIGLRLSHAPPTQDEVAQFPLPSTTYDTNAKRPVSPLSVERKSTSQPILQLVSFPVLSPRKPSPLVTNMLSPKQSNSPRESYSNKTLPPTPKAASFSNPTQRIAEPSAQLSPGLYSPERRSPKPTVAPQSPIIPPLSPLNSSPIGPERF